MSDILFKTEGYVFSYRVAGICIKHGRVLLQKPANDDGFAFPGGHVAFGETNEETLIREFREEIGAEISVGELKWVGELFFRWGDVPCHQICLYYLVDILTPEIPKTKRHRRMTYLWAKNISRKDRLRWNFIGFHLTSCMISPSIRPISHSFSAVLGNP